LAGQGQRLSEKFFTFYDMISLEEANKLFASSKRALDSSLSYFEKLNISLSHR